MIVFTGPVFGASCASWRSPCSCSGAGAADAAALSGALLPDRAAGVLGVQRVYDLFQPQDRIRTPQPCSHLGTVGPGGGRSAFFDPRPPHLPKKPRVASKGPATRLPTGSAHGGPPGHHAGLVPFRAVVLGCREPGRIRPRPVGHRLRSLPGRGQRPAQRSTVDRQIGDKSAMRPALAIVWLADRQGQATLDQVQREVVQERAVIQQVTAFQRTLLPENFRSPTARSLVPRQPTCSLPAAAVPRPFARARNDGRNRRPLGPGGGRSSALGRTSGTRDRRPPLPRRWPAAARASPVAGTLRGGPRRPAATVRAHHHQRSGRFHSRSTSNPCGCWSAWSTRASSTQDLGGGGQREVQQPHQSRPS